MALILIVEDEEQVRVLAESYLREQGHRTLTASTRAEALAALDVADGINVLFTDLSLSGEIDAGLVLAQDAVERHPDLRVLYATEQTVTDGMRARFVEGAALLEKPYTTEQLQASLAVHFGLRPSATTGTPPPAGPIRTGPGSSSDEAAN
jgi:DNA-binding NtrC family response regulator